MVAAIMVLAELLIASIAYAQPDQHKKVLVLYSTRRDAQFSVVGESELPRILDEGLSRNLDYYAEFIDVTRFPDRTYRQGFRDFLQVKYQGVRFDLVLALQSAAVEFVNGLDIPLVRETPLVFLTNTSRTTRRPNSTGVLHECHFLPTLDLVRQLQPDVRNLFIVTGAAAADEDFENEIRRQMPSSDARLSVTYLSGMTSTDLEYRLGRLPPRSAVYHVLVTEDGAGKKFHPLDYVDRVSAAANAPTYCWVESAMNRGIVGGNLYSQAEAVTRVGQLALRVLHGDRPAGINTTAVNLNSIQIDWRQLRRWGIDERRLPAEAAIRFREPTLW
jgi:hypothetical protein